MGGAATAGGSSGVESPPVAGRRRRFRETVDKPSHSGAGGETTLTRHPASLHPDPLPPLVCELSFGGDNQRVKCVKGLGQELTGTYP